jgi:tRNA A37 threonylcarbamoyladenosine dehydratase
MNLEFLPPAEEKENSAGETATPRRFDRMARLVGDEGLQGLLHAHVMVVGLGGVGSYAAEMLARSGIGRLTLVDFDEICITNVNRQLHALQGTIGKAKAQVLAERFSRINPKAEFVPLTRFYNPESSEELLAWRPNYVLDAIDSVTAKAHLLATCRQKAIPVVSSAGAGGRIDPTRIRIADLAATTVDPLARMMRSILRSQYGFPAEQLFGIPCVYSLEPCRPPQALAYDEGKGFRCVCPQGQNEFWTCDNRNLIHGTAGFVTGAFGFTAASVLVRHVVGQFAWPQAGAELPTIAERNSVD